MSEISKIFEGLPKKFQKGNLSKARTFYFSLGEEEKWTVALAEDKCTVTRGKPDGDADCFSRPRSRCSSTSGTARTRPRPRTS